MNPNVRGVVFERLGGLRNVRLIDPVPYDDLVFLLGRSWMVLTDSGGIQEEAPSLGKPVVVMRPTTERPEAVEAGCAVLGGNRARDIVAAFRRIADDESVHRSMSQGINPYGDGTASRAIVRLCDELL
jgi:UDP-N-acetylglucosamine 2-epimerase (non-hydrolysing)